MGNLSILRGALPSAQVSAYTTGSITLPSARTAFVPPTDFESIASFTATGSETTTTFSSIPQTYKHLQLRYSLRSDPSGNAFLRFNGNNPNNYYQYGAGASGTAGNYEMLRNTQFYISGTAYGLDATYATVGIIDINDYTSTVSNKSYKGFLGKVGTANSSSETWWMGGFVALDTNAITSLVLVTSNAMVSGSVISLYGIKV